MNQELRPRDADWRLTVRGNGGGLARIASATLGPSWTQYLEQFICSQTPISVVMSHDVVSVGPTMSVESLTTLLLERGLGAVPVIDETGRLLGVVSTTDLLREAQDHGDVEERIPLHVPGRRGVQMRLGEGFHITCLARATVEEIMTPFAITLPETASMVQAAALMTMESVNQLLIVDSGYKVVGALTALDVMRWLTRQSGFLLPPTVRTTEDEHASIAGLERGLLAIAATIDCSIAGPSMQAAKEDSPLADGPFLPLKRMAKVHECPACRQRVTEVCGDSLAERSWFQLGPRLGLCSVHRGRAGMGS